MDTSTLKQLTPENLLEPDPCSLAFAYGLDRSTGQVREMSRDEFLGWIFDLPRLAAAVPDEVRSLTEGARGAMCYGYYFYPLFMVGVEQSFRAAEAAVRHKVHEIEGPWSASSFLQLVDYLVKQGVIAEADKERWDAIRRLRNEAAHPKLQQQLPPGPSISMLATVAGAINQLFAETD